MLRTWLTDGQPVRLWVDRLTVREFDAVLTSSWPRGTDRSALREAVRLREQIDAVDDHIEVFEGDLLLDGQPVTSAAAVFAGQTATISALFDFLIEGQVLSPEERHALTVGVRFMLWLAREHENNSGSKWIETGTSCAKCHELQLCEKRACGATPSKKPVWHDKKLHVRVCPVKSLTPEVERVIRLFEWTHAWRASGFEQIALPGTAHLEDQEAWTMAALAHVRGLYGDVYREWVPHHA